jgi:hypothetical protein
MAVALPPSTTAPPGSSIPRWLGQSDFYEHARLAKGRFSGEFLRVEDESFARYIPDETPDPEINVVGVSLGDRRVQGRSTGELALKVFVRRKFPLSVIPEEYRLPPAFDGVRIDVEQIGLIRTLEAESNDFMPNPMAPAEKISPGMSIGACSCEMNLTGTLGVIVKDRKGVPHILSSDHILRPACDHPSGPFIFAPSVRDAGNREPSAEFRVGISSHSGLVSQVDAAIAAILVDFDPGVLYVGGPAAVVPAEAGMLVHKFGRTTRYTRGLVLEAEGDVKVYSRRLGTNIKYQNQIVIEWFQGTPFSEGGDSGSLVLRTKTNEAVGLLFSGADGYSFANHAWRVMDELEVDMVPS